MSFKLLLQQIIEKKKIGILKIKFTPGKNILAFTDFVHYLPNVLLGVFFL
jgi:hypothetical protein